MKYLLDTDILIYWMKGNKAIAHNAAEAGRDNVSYSTISKAELYFGAYNSSQVEKNLNAVERLGQTIAIRPFDEAAAEQFGKIKADLKQKGQIILDADLMIAAIAIAHSLTLVTNNTKHFERIPNLRLENWSEN